jgi:hypothetical protein
MRSHEVLKSAIDSIGVKAIAAQLQLSPALIYKWCQPSGPDELDASGALNPLDRVAEIIRATGDESIIRWLCHAAGGFFVRNPPTESAHVGTELVVNTQRLVKEFSDLLLAVTRSIEDDGAIALKEAGHIRMEWEQFKGLVEAFTLACDRGAFARTAKDTSKDRGTKT